MITRSSKFQSIKTTYDNLALDYHLLFADWKKSVHWHGRVLDNLIKKEKGDAPLSILDCTCGIGTQAIGLALHGHSVTGTDISYQAIKRAREEAKSSDVKITFKTVDLLRLNTQIKDSFDVIISCDNSLPHFIDDTELKKALSNIYAKLKPNGIFIASIRNYDEIIENKIKTTIPQVFDDADGYRIVFQTWDWNDNGTTYIFHLYILKNKIDDWEVKEYIGRYRALRRQELYQNLFEVNFTNIKWLMPEKTKYYQPIVVCHK